MPLDPPQIKRRKIGRFGAGFQADSLFFLYISLPKYIKKKKKKKPLIPLFSQQSKGSILALFFLSLVLGPWIWGLRGVDVAF